ncbi:MAG: S24/S26 family peptidase [Thermoanaerobaculia bacterium]
MIDAADVIADLLARGHDVRFQARGDSMHPAIREDDYLHVSPLRGDVRRGDVLVMLADRGLTVHRVLAQRGEMIFARGDNAPAEDPPLHRSRVIGKVLAIERDGRTKKMRRSVWIAALIRALRRFR